MNYFENIAENIELESDSIIAYHGSHVPIEKFDRNFSAQGVFWFSEEVNKIKSGSSGAVSSKYIIKVKLNVNNWAGWDEYEKLFLQELRDKGYDSIKLDDDWVVFDSDDIEILKIYERQEDGSYELL
jgi:hypothetical protein